MYLLRTFGVMKFVVGEYMMLADYRNRLINIIKAYFPDCYLSYDNPPFGYTEWCESILAELAYKTIQSKENKFSIRKHLNDDDNDAKRKQLERWYNQTIDFRKLTYNKIFESKGIKLEGLLEKKKQSMKEKLNGYSLQPSQICDLEFRNNVRLIKAIEKGKLYERKKNRPAEYKIPNSEFVNLFNEYDEYVENFKLEYTTPAMLSLAGAEFRYNIELMYACVVEAEKLDFPDIPDGRLKDLYGVVDANVVKLYTALGSCRINDLVIERRMLKYRMKLVPLLFKDDWPRTKIYTYQIIKNMILSDAKEIETFDAMISDEEKLRFLKNDYDIFGIYVKKEWNKERIKYMRKLFSEIGTFSV